MPGDGELEINVALFDALSRALERKPTEPEPVILLAAYLLSLAKDYGLSDSQHLKGHHLERVAPPTRAADFIGHCIANADTIVSADLVRERLYAVFLDLSEDEVARTALNRAARISDVGLRKIAQVCWNIDAVNRPLLPIQPRVATTDASSKKLDIPVAASGDADFARMNWTDRTNEGVHGLGDGRANSSSKAALRNKAAVLAVLAAQRILDTTSKPWPEVEGAVLHLEDSGDGKSRGSIMWPDAQLESTKAAEIAPATDGRLDIVASRPPAPILTSKPRAYLAIDSFEQDLRRCIELFLLDQFRSQDALLERDRLSDEPPGQGGADPQLATARLSSQQAYDVLLRHLSDLPAELADALRLNRASLDRFIPVRNRVMHRRSLQPDDLIDTEAFVARFRSRHFPQTEAALADLESNSGWQPRPRIGSTPAERIPHNLPESDFDETGLLGREAEVDDIVDKLKQRRGRMFTLVGEGGIGKTALALEVCYRLVDDPESPFDAILWTSLKSEELTETGVRELSNAILDMDSATRALGQAVDQAFTGSEKELADALGDRTTLIVIDNLETAQGKEVLRLWDQLPISVSFLFTSRVGVGELERRIPIGPLELDSAMDLFRKVARNHGQMALAHLSDDVLRERLSRLRYSPLAIRWYILSVESGHAPADTLRNQSELLEFCVGNVIAALSDEDRLLLVLLRGLDRPVSFDELVVLSKMEIDALRSGYHRLAQSSLIVVAPSVGHDESDAVALSSTARAYLPTLADAAVTADIIQRDLAYTQELELQRSRIVDHGRYLDVNVIFERPSFNDGPTAHLLRQALREDKVDDLSAVSATMARARSLNPEYFEVHRVDAFLASRRRETERATALYRSALGSCATQEERSWVGYFFAGHLARQASDLPTAIGWAEEAHKFFDGYDSALQLGNFYVWDQRFVEGLKLVQLALDRAPKQKHQLIATTAFVDGFRRWSEAELAAGRAHGAVDRATDGVDVGFKLHSVGLTDDQLMLSILRAATAALQALGFTSMPPTTQVERLAASLDRLVADPSLGLLPSWRQLLYTLSSLPTETRTRLGPELSALSTLGRADRAVGSVGRMRDKFGFIEHPDFPSNLYFNAAALRAPTRMSDLRVGSQIEFTLFVDGRGRDQAIDVVLLSVGALKSA